MHGVLEIVDDVPQAFARLVELEHPTSIALSGGDTARRCYELLAVADVPWSDTSVFFGDERWVPIDHPDSNEGMARVTFLDQVQPAAVNSMYAAGPTPPEAAQAYDQLVRAAPPIHLTHLGLGEDGHTGSLFPGSSALDESDALVVTNGDDFHPHERLTFTIPAIARSPLVVFTVSGAGKQEALARVRRDEPIPASRVSAERVVWLVDRAAAGEA